MGAGIMARIAGGLSNQSIASAVAGSQLGIIYGTGAGYTSGQRSWSYGGRVSFSDATRANAQVSVGPRILAPVSKPKPGTRVYSLDQAIADATQNSFFGSLTGRQKDLYQETPVVVQAPAIPRQPVMLRPRPLWTGADIKE